MFIYPEELDKRLGWKPGRAERLARQRRLPHTLLPDGSIRFEWKQIEPLIVHVPAAIDYEPANSVPHGLTHLLLQKTFWGSLAAWDPYLTSGFLTKNRTASAKP